MFGEVWLAVVIFLLPVNLSWIPAFAGMTEERQAGMTEERQAGMTEERQAGMRDSERFRPVFLNLYVGGEFWRYIVPNLG